MSGHVRHFESELRMPSRREFVRLSSLALALPCGLSCGSGEDDRPAGSCSGVGATSTVVEGHSHEICVPASDLESGISVALLYTTSTDQGHTHQITLSREQLESLTNAGTIEVTSTVAFGHRHAFTLIG